MLCLVGGQGAGKSTFFRFLACKDEWFSDDLKKIDDDGEGKLRMLIDQNPHEDFYVMNGNRALIKREKFERYLDQATAV